MTQNIPKKVFEEFVRIGSWLDRRGLNTSHSGNLSRRVGERIYITRSGAMLGDLTPGDILQVFPPPPYPGDAKPSVETPVHLAIYSRSEYNAVIHAHPPFTVALSLKGLRSIVPLDVEGKEVLGEVPVLHLKEPAGSQEAAEEISRAFEGGRVVVVAAHGVFAGGKDLPEALHLISSLEFSSKVLLLTALKLEVRE